MYLLSDEDFPGPIQRGLLQRLPELDLVRAYDVGLAGQADPHLLAWAATNNRIVLSSDRSTLADHAWNRVSQGLPMPGVFLLRRFTSIGAAVSELEEIVICSSQDEWRDQVVYIPF